MNRYRCQGTFQFAYCADVPFLKSAKLVNTRERSPWFVQDRSTLTSPQTSPSPAAKTTPPPQPVRQTPTVPPPPRTVFVRQPSPPPPQPVLQAARPQPIQPAPASPAPQPSPAVDPFERWSQLAFLGQTRGLTTRETALNSEGQPTFGANSSATSSTTTPTIGATHHPSVLDRVAIARVRGW